MGAGAWGIAAPVISFFVGGLIAGRAAATGVDRASSVIAGLATWAVAAIRRRPHLGMVVSSLAGGAVSLGTSAAGAATDAVGKAATGIAGQADHVGDVVKAMGAAADGALAPVNQRHHAEGKPEITAPQLESAARSVIRDAVGAGTLDRAVLMREISSPPHSRRPMRRKSPAGFRPIRQGAQRSTPRVAEAKGAALHVAQIAANSTGKLILALLGALALAAPAAVGSAALGGRSVRHGNRRLPVRPANERGDPDAGSSHSARARNSP